MTDSNKSSTVGGQSQETDGSNKGKGKATEQVQDISMDEGGDDEDDTSEDEVDETAINVDEADDDNMEEIDTSNIISGGRRTRGRQIDFAKAAQELPEEEDDEDEDDDFEAPVEDDKMED